MLYTIAEISDLIHLSKVSIYKKLKLKELQEHIVKQQGITYIDEVGFNLIKSKLNLNTYTTNELNENADNNMPNDEVSMDSEALNLKEDYINTLKQQLIEKDKQIESLHELIKNNQVLLKQEQDKEKQKNLPELEAHFKDLDCKLTELRSEMQQRKKKNKLFNIFQKE